MPSNKSTTPAELQPISEQEERQVLINAIQARFPRVNFKEWGYYHIGHLLNFYERGSFAAYDYAQFFTDLLLFLIEHDLSDKFKKEVGEYPMEMLKNLNHFFQMIVDTDTQYAFVDYFKLNMGGKIDSEKVVELAKEYLVDSNRERIYVAHPEIDPDLL